MSLKRLSYVSGIGKPLLGKTIGDVLRETTRKFPNNDALLSLHENSRWTYSELLQRSEQIAEGLLALGLPRHSRVGIFSPTCKDWTLTQLGTALSDLILVNINPASQISELEYMLNKAQVSALIMPPSFRTSNYINMVENLVPEINSSKIGEISSSKLPHLKHVILIGNQTHKGMLNFDELYHQKTKDYKEVTHDISFDDPSYIIFTSGTTGKPKGVVLSHHGVVNCTHNITDLLEWDETDKVVVSVPLYHVFGSMANICCVTRGSTIVYPDYVFKPGLIMDTVESEKITSLLGVPTMFQLYLNEQEKQKRNVESLKTAFSTGSGIDRDTMNRIIHELHIKNVTNAFAMTETSGSMFQMLHNSPFEKKVNTAGVIHPNLEAKLINKKGKIVEIGEVGEICIRGYSVFKHYWGDEKATKETIDGNGWMHTGDLGTLDEDGYLRIVGRNKDLIIRGGENIYPAEIENLLMKHPDIEMASIFGIPDHYGGEQVCAWIKMKPGKTDITHAGVVEYLKGKLSDFKIPRTVKIVSSFPMTSSGKVMKYVMKDMHMQELKNNN
ncbi:unnamed protein product [Blepharisma stoltei]|uniref:Uncharacterized protein n=1 Tax=Blepharisma stoltei TaxID=1481888 RepID=A0AAU9JNP9_9CILI|nr:unnamed protein product [Blepharisma stoltei]